MTTVPQPQAQPQQAQAQPPSPAPAQTPLQSGNGATIQVHRYALPAVLLLTCAVFLRTLNYEFVYDDWALIMTNPWLETWKSLPRFFVSHVWQMYGDHITSFHYRPIYSLWLLLMQKTVGRITPWWHLISVLLHMTATWLVFRLTEVLTRNQWTSLLAAAIFGLYPVHVESVAWVSVCGDLLAAIFLMAGFLEHLRWQEDRTRRWARAASIAWFVAGILTKETALTFPAVVVVESWWRDSEVREKMNFRGRVRDLMGVIWPYAAGCAAYLIVRAAIFNSRHGFVTRAAEYDRLPQIPVVYLSYLKVMFLAWRPTLFYDIRRFTHLSPADVLWVPLVLGLLLWLGLKARHSQTVRIALTWWLLMNAVPVLAGIKLRKDYWLHDRNLYLASIGFVIVAAVVLSEWFDNHAAGTRMRAALCILIAAVFSTMITLNLGRFQSEATLYSDAYQHAPANMRARVLYALLLEKQGRAEESAQVNLETLRLDPTVWEAEDILGNLALKQNDKEKAMEHFLRAYDKAPNMLKPDVEKEIQELQSGR